MSRGDIHFFASWDLKSKTGVSFNLGADTLKLGIVTNAVIPSVGTNDPRWGGAGTTDFSAIQVGTATAYTGPITLTGVSFTRTAGVNKLDFDDVSIALDAVGFTNGYYAIVYDDTVSGKYAIGYIDLGGPISIVGGPLNINLNVGGFGTDTAT